MRDLHTLFWMAKYVYRVREPDELLEQGVFDNEEFAVFRRCEDFLWSVRCHIHFVTGRAEERLSFDIQREIAVRLGYTEHPGMKDVERFMKHYFLVAKDVGDLTAILCAELEERQAAPAPVLSRMIARFRPAGRRTLPETDDFIIDNNRINVANPDVFRRDPLNLLAIFRLAQSHNLALHPDATRAIRRSLKVVDRNFRQDEKANQLFLQILTSQEAEIVLRWMNETGVLGRFIHAFGRIVAMMQFNMYHHYTVDEHLLRCIGVLAEIERGDNEEFALANDLMRKIQPQNRAVLYITLFLHDIAKGRTEDHSIAGARIARRMCPRLGFSPAETDTVAWLIEQHLVMSSIAQSRDLSDRKTIENFAAVVQSLERLKLLTILTTADIRAVGPGVWNGWKAQLLRTLYYETEPVLTGGFSEVNRAQRVAIAQAEFQEQIKDWPAEQREAYVARHYPAYWLKVDLPHQLAHARFLRDAEKQQQTLATSVAFDAERGVTELTVLAPDHPWLLSIIAGACAVTGANIVDAQIYTTTDGLALDTISISREFDMEEDELRRADAHRRRHRTRVARGSEAAGDDQPARGAQGADQGLCRGAGRRHQQSVVAPLYRGGGNRSRPARLALCVDHDLVEAQPQYHVGSRGDLRRTRGGRVLCHRFAGRQDLFADPAGGDQARLARLVCQWRGRRGRPPQKRRGQLIRLALQGSPGVNRPLKGLWLYTIEFIGFFCLMAKMQLTLR